MIAVGRLAPGNQWDQNMVDRLLDNTLYPTGLEFHRHEGYPHADGCVLVIPGRYWHDSIHDIDDAIASYRWVLGVRTGDEEDLFDIHEVAHPNIRWWVQTPRPDRDYGDARLFGVGFPPHFNHLPAGPPEKLIDVFLAGQDTHDRRHRAFGALQDAPLGIKRVERTAGFTQGMDPAEYVECMLMAKTAPAPAGPVSADTFRVYEALEAHTVPLADTISPAVDEPGFWDRIFVEHMGPLYTNPAALPDLVAAVLDDATDYANHVTAAWMRYKRQLALWLREDLEQLGAL